LYARASKAVSLIPAAYYADLACERGRCYLNDFLVGGDGKSVVSSGSGGKGKGREEEKEEVFRAAKKAWGDGVSASFFYGGSFYYFLLMVTIRCIRG
jgi:eukaryotic translation initiation factor 2C